MRTPVPIVVTLLLSGMLAACVPDRSKPLPVAAASLEPVGTSSIRGRVTFGDQEGLTRVFVDVTGLTGEHGFHIHEAPDCRTAIASVGTTHFNPEKKPHGQHMGDLPNIRSDVYGTMRDAFLVQSLVLSGKDSIVGHALIITSNYDDFKTQPDGRSGQAVACGVIQKI